MLARRAAAAAARSRAAVAARRRPAATCSYPVTGPVTSPFGYRIHPIYHYWGLHDGVDFGAGLRRPARRGRAAAR